MKTLLSCFGKAIWILILLAALGSGCAFQIPNLQKQDGQTKPQRVKISAAPQAMIAIPLKQLQPYGFLDSEQQEWVLSLRGHPIPFWVIDDDQPQLVFYSPATRSQYWQENVFLLEPKAAFARSLDPALASFIWTPAIPTAWSGHLANGTALATIILEENQIYQALSEGDHWFWQKLQNNQQQNITMLIEEKPLGEVFLRFVLYSATEAPAQPDHALKITVNDSLIKEIVWDGKGWQQIEVTIPAQSIQFGENQLSLFVPGLEGIFAQLSFLDRVEVFYPQELPPKADQVSFFATGNLGEVFQGYDQTREWIWQIDDALAPEQIKPGKDLSTDNVKRYLWLKEKGFRKASKIEPLQQLSNENSYPSEIAYLAIGTGELLKPLQPLLELRQAEGLTVKTIEVEEIYDQYYGFAEAQALRAYLAKAARQYPALRYVLLVGDTTYDPAQYITSAEMNRLPTFFIDTIYGGQTSTEIPFAIIDQDNLDFLDTLATFEPSLAIGRLPASSPQQVRQWVEKVLAYEKGEKKPKTKAILAIADPQEATFERDATAFLELWKGQTSIESFFPNAGETSLEQEIRGRFDRDYRIIAYFGHGAIDLWGKDEIFTAQQAKELGGQTSYPIVLNFTCLTGYYIHPEVLSLTEALLWNPKGGAISIIAPTSLTLADDQSFLWKALVESYQSQPDGRIGDVWLSALPKIALANEGIRDVVLTYTLFGDPALTLP